MSVRAQVLALSFSLVASVAYAGPLLGEGGGLSLDGALLAQNTPPPPPPPTQTLPPPGYAYPQPVYQQQPYPQQGYPQQGYPQQGYPPPGYGQPPRQLVTMEQPRYGLAIAGLCLFGAGWLFDITTTYSVGHDPAWESAVPIAGPLLQTNDTYSSTDARDVARFFLVWDFVLQAVGATMAIVGLTVKKTVTVYADGTPPAAPKGTTFTFLPSGHGGAMALTW